MRFQQDAGAEKACPELDATYPQVGKCRDQHVEALAAVVPADRHDQRHLLTAEACQWRRHWPRLEVVAEGGRGNVWKPTNRQSVAVGAPRACAPIRG